MARFASRIDADGLLNIAIDELDPNADVDLDKMFAEKPEMRSIVGIPRYYSQKHGYWPLPADGWKIIETAN